MQCQASCRNPSLTPGKPADPRAGPLSKDEQLWLAAVKLLQAVAPGAIGAGTAPEMLAEALQLQADIGLRCSRGWAAGPVRLRSLQWMQQTAALALSSGLAAAAAVEAALPGAARVAVEEAGGSSAQHREAALSALRSMVALFQEGGRALLQDPALLADVCWTAIRHSADVSPTAAAAARDTLLALGSLLAACGGGDLASSAADPAGFQYAAALQPQQRAFRAQQLTQLFAALSKPITDAPGSPGSDPAQGWLVRLAQSLAALPPGAVKSTGYQGSTVHPE